VTTEYVMRCNMRTYRQQDILGTTCKNQAPSSCQIALL
jgi:hypothetical protein